MIVHVGKIVVLHLVHQYVNTPSIMVQNIIYVYKKNVTEVYSRNCFLVLFSNG